EGRCFGGDGVEWCAGGSLRQRRCPAGTACAFVDDSVGYWCAAMGGTPTDPDAGVSPPRDKGSFGAPCSAAPDCISGLCLADPSGSSFCTNPCSATAPCPSDHQCLPSGAAVNVCAKATTAVDAGTP